MHNLSIVRGTSFQFLVRVLDSLRERYILSTGEELIFGVKRFPEHKKYQILKKVGADEYNDEVKGYIFTIEPEDTADFVFDDYFYDIGLSRPNGEFYNVVECSKFTIKKNITMKGV